MAKKLYFEGVQVGDVYVRAEDATESLTPPTRQAGLFQEFAAVDSSSRNLLYGIAFVVTVKEANECLATKAVMEIKELKGRVGKVEVKDGGSAKIRCDDWTIDDVQTTKIDDAFAGRFVENVTIKAVGSKKPFFASS